MADHPKGVWIRHDGGPSPLPADTAPSVLLAGGQIIYAHTKPGLVPHRADQLDWLWANPFADLIEKRGEPRTGENAIARVAGEYWAVLTADLRIVAWRLDDGPWGQALTYAGRAAGGEIPEGQRPADLAEQYIGEATGAAQPPKGTTT